MQPAMKNFLIKQQGLCSGFLYLDGQETGIYVGNTWSLHKQSGGLLSFPCFAIRF